MLTKHKLLTDFADQIASRQYYHKDQEGNPVEDYEGMLRRVARHVARAEAVDAYKNQNGDYPEWYKTLEGRKRMFTDVYAIDTWIDDHGYRPLCDTWEERFFDLMIQQKFSPAGRILAGAETPYGGMLNCYVLGANGNYIEGAKQSVDSVDGIYELSYKLAKVTKTGGGCGINLDFMRESGAYVQGSGGRSSGPVSFLRLNYNTTLRVIKLEGVRRGAGMATMSIWHPDVLDFITAKDADREALEGKIEAFNISLLITDAFMQAVEGGGDVYFKSVGTGQHVAPSPVMGKYHLPGQKSTSVTGNPNDPATSKEIPVVDTPNGPAVSARWLWDEIAHHAWESGDPGIIFIDRVNEFWPLLDSLGPIKATNPCLTGDTKILTLEGPRTFKELADAGEDVLVYSIDPETNSCGVNWMRNPHQTGTELVYEIEFDSGLVVGATADHKFLRPSGGYVTTRELTPKSRVSAFTLHNHRDGHLRVQRVLRDGTREHKYVHRMVAECVHGDVGNVVVHHKDHNPENNQPYNLEILGVSEHNSVHYGRRVQAGLGSREMTDTLKVQLSESLKEYYRADDNLKEQESRKAHLKRPRVPRILKACGYCGEVAEYTEKALAKRLRESASGEVFCGSICVNKYKGTTGTAKKFSTEQMLDYGIILAEQLNKNTPSSIDWKNHRGADWPSHEAVRTYFGSWERFTYALQDYQAGLVSNPVNHRVVGVRVRGVEPVYNGMVENHHTYIVVDPESISPTGIYTGIVSKNCGEQPLFEGEPCCLGSMVLDRYVKAGSFQAVNFFEDVKLATRFLDDVLTMHVHPIEDTQIWADRLRRVGLGVMGDAAMCMLMGIGYASEEAMQLRRDVARWMLAASGQASMELAAEKGAFPFFSEMDISDDVDFRRNVHTLSIAPTGSIAMIADTTSGIEPLFALGLQRRVGNTYKFRLDPTFERYLRDHRTDIDLDDADAEVSLMVGYDTAGKDIRETVKMPAVIQAILENHGGIQGLDEWFSKAEQATYVTAHDVSPEDHVRVQGVWQRSLDSEFMLMSSISKTTNLPNSATIEDVKRIYALAFAERVKGVTMYRDGSKQSQVLRTDLGKKAEKEVEKSEPKPVEVKKVVKKDKGGTYRPRRTSGEMVKAEFRDANGKERKVYIYVGLNDVGYPVEVFITDEDGGQDVHPYAAALGKVISTALKYGAAPEKIAKKLRKIEGGSMSYGEGIYASVPAMVGRLLDEAVRNYQDAIGTHEAGISFDCDGNCNMVSQGGCDVCLDCGKSKCS